MASQQQVRREPSIVSVAQIEQSQLLLQLAVPEDLTCFAGHFPDFPILPGVVQLDWVVALAALHLQLEGHVQSVERLKFMRPIRPGQQLSLELVFNAARQWLDFTYQYQGQVCAKGRCVYEPITE